MRGESERLVCHQEVVYGKHLTPGHCAGCYAKLAPCIEAVLSPSACYLHKSTYAQECVDYYFDERQDAQLIGPVQSHPQHLS